MSEREGEDAAAADGATPAPPSVPVVRRRPISMHENVSPWADHCSCGAEPYWLAVAEELGIDVDAGNEEGAA
ncbi:MAG: hypothetical protein MUE39_07420 [Gammaproteobacteria bacterium]|nr:hypothetical protein [Gammaproteobacteria bacterium]